MGLSNSHCAYCGPGTEGVALCKVAGAGRIWLCQRCRDARVNASITPQPPEGQQLSIYDALEDINGTA